MEGVGGRKFLPAGSQREFSDLTSFRFFGKMG